MSVGNLKDQLDGSEIDLSLNNLTEVPVEVLAKIPEATHLDLSCNLITSLPDDFCTLVHLVKLDLSKNKLKELPANFGRLVNLQFLDLMGNDLTELPPSFGDLGCLEWLDLKGNPLVSDLMEKAGDCLNEQQCQECAKNVIGFLKKVDSLTEEKEETPRKSKCDVTGQQWLFSLSRLPAVLIVIVGLGVGTFAFGSSRLCRGAMEPAFAYICHMTEKIVRQAAQLRNGVNNTE